MAKTKVKELVSIAYAKSGCKRACCDPDPKKVPHWKVWEFSRRNPGVNPFRD